MLLVLVFFRLFLGHWCGWLVGGSVGFPVYVDIDDGVTLFGRVVGVDLVDDVAVVVCVWCVICG